MKLVDYEHFGRFALPHTLSARGDTLFFCVKRADFADNKYRSDLYCFSDGKTRRLTSSGDVNAYALLDSGIVFPSLRAEKDKAQAKAGVPLTVLQRLPYDGGEAEEWLRLPETASDFRFLSEDRFFFAASASFAFEQALAAHGGDAEKAAESLKEDADYQVIDELPYWFNGQGFINGTRTRVCLYDRGGIRKLTPERDNADIAGLSADGKTLYYTLRHFEGVTTLSDRLFALDTETLQATEITVAAGTTCEGVVPLPDGGLLALISMHARYGLNENAQVFRKTRAGWECLYDGSLHSFENSVGSDVKASRAMPSVPMVRDGVWYFRDTQDDSTVLSGMALASGTVAPVTRTRGNISDAVLYADGFAAIAMRDGGGCELYRIALDGTETCLTAFNTGLAAEYAYSAPQDLYFRNERGETIHGWAIPPVGCEAGKRYPTILDIHGGPKTVYGGCYFHEMQLWASRGYGVIFCNPTGSDGKGDAFADIRGCYGQIDYRDIMAFTDCAIQSFDWIDPAHMGVTGGSYGGFMTNWIIGHTDRFKAAASQRSISNWTSFHNTTDIGFYFGTDQNGGDVWHDLQKVWDQSPLQFADRVKTPTLFIHSDEDYRCWMAEGLQMFTAIRLHGVETRLCLFHGENHELSRSGKPKHRVRRLREITEWFDKYLKA